jgi:hypothetical protein
VNGFQLIATLRPGYLLSSKVSYQTYDGLMVLDAMMANIDYVHHPGTAILVRAAYPSPGCRTA